MKLLHPLPHEKVVLVIRRHWFIFLTRLSFHILLLLAPLPVVWFGSIYFAYLFSSDLLYPIAVVFLTIYYLAIWLVFYMTFIDLYLDVWVITNKRILNIEQFGLFSRTEAEHQLSVIQDVTTEVHGIFATMLNYGDVQIQTASESQGVIFRQIPEPYFAKKIISDMIERKRREEGASTDPLKG